MKLLISLIIITDLNFRMVVYYVKRDMLFSCLWCMIAARGWQQSLNIKEVDPAITTSPWSKLLQISSQHSSKRPC